MKNKVFTKTIAVLLIVFALSFAASAQTAGNPVTKTRLTAVLQVKTVSMDLIVSTIQRNGVDFVVTKADEAELRKLGADDNLIKAVRENYRGGVTPTSNDANASFTKAVELGDKGDFAGAERAARQAVKANPRFGEAYVVLGGALAELERYEEAVAAVTKALELLPKHSEARPETENLLTELKKAAAASGNESAKNQSGDPSATNANNQTNTVTEDADGTVLADRPILKCPVEQKSVKNGTAPDLKILEKVFRCQSGEKPAAKGMDGAFIINVEAMQIGTPRKMDYLKDKGDGTPGVTVVYPIKITWTEKTFYRTRTAVVEKKIAIVNFNVNTLNEWQYGSATNISDGTYKSIPGN